MSPDSEGGAPMAVWPDTIFALTLFVEDLAEARRFYRQVFDLQLVFEDANSAVFKIGDTLINLLVVEAAGELVNPAPVGARNAGARFVVSLRVDDVDALCAELVARGVALLNGPMDRPWGIRTASFADPGGHIWEVGQDLGRQPGT